MQNERALAAREAMFCEKILAKSSENILLATLKDALPETWSHYPPGDIFDPETGAQWYYHCHPPTEDIAEHGHFHCFIRPEGNKGPIHHMIGIGVNAYGQLVRLFTVNQWVVGDDWLSAEASIDLLPRFDVHMNHPSYLVNRWVTAIVRLYGGDIADLIMQRDMVIAAHTPQNNEEARADRALEVTSELVVDLHTTARELGLDVAANG